MSDQKNSPAPAQPSSSSQSSNSDKAHNPVVGRNKDPVAQTSVNSVSKSALVEGAADRPLVGIISERFPPFDAEALIATPFSEETANDAKLEEVFLYLWASARIHSSRSSHNLAKKLVADRYYFPHNARPYAELCNMLLSTLLKTHAWMASRPKYEAGIASRQLEGDISRIIERERQQGMSSSHSLPTLPASPSPTPSIVSVSSSVRERGFVDETRERLGEFVQRMKTALSALLGGVSFE